MYEPHATLFMVTPNTTSYDVISFFPPSNLHTSATEHHENPPFLSERYMAGMTYVCKCTLLGCLDPHQLIRGLQNYHINHQEVLK